MFNFKKASKEEKEKALKDFRLWLDEASKIAKKSKETKIHENGARETEYFTISLDKIISNKFLSATLYSSLYTCLWQALDRNRLDPKDLYYILKFISRNELNKLEKREWEYLKKEKKTFGYSKDSILSFEDDLITAIREYLPEVEKDYHKAKILEIKEEIKNKEEELEDLKKELKEIESKL